MSYSRSRARSDDTALVTTVMTEVLVQIGEAAMVTEGLARTRPEV